MLEQFNDMDEDTQKKLKLVVFFGIALVILLILALVLGELLGEKATPRDDFSGRTRSTAPR
ncbi:MAG TPA: hypothetical protein VEJ63_09320 [Planctomycetota bacterium]|nr:hypothetical protein [Planctomycetota bacterium]